MKEQSSLGWQGLPDLVQFCGIRHETGGKATFCDLFRKDSLL